MRKISLTSKRLFLLVFIVLSLLVIVPTECYAKTSTVFGSTHDVDNDLEVQAMAQITQYIYDCSVVSGYTSYNWFGSETTQDHIFDAAFGVSHTYSISFFVGHGRTGTVLNGIVPEQQWWIYDDDGNRVYDREIYPYSECKNVRFIFLWSCYQGDTIGGKHCVSGTHYGMPYAWVHTTDLSTDGYASPDNNGYCFIGFDGKAPYILKEFDGRYGVGYYFIGHFYRAALCGDKTINEALDYASQKIWSVNFDESILYNGLPGYGKMVVYGDGNLNVGQSVTAPTLPPAPSEDGNGGGVGGCPTLFVYDGTSYVDYGVIDIHNPSGEDIVREVPVQAEDVGISNSKAVFRLREGWDELKFSESFIDQVKLYAINEDGKQKLCPLISATHSRLGDVRKAIVSSDDVKVQMLLLETIELTFKASEDIKGKGFIFVTEGCNQYKEM